MGAPSDCAACPRLVESRRQVVNGFGPIPADVMVIAQNPGAQEERPDVGRPLYEHAFSGKSLRTKLMPRANIDPTQVRFENVVRCRPPRKSDGSGDYPPTKSEVNNCRTYLLDEIRNTQPKLIITLGAPALKWFDPDKKLSQCHGQIFAWEIPNGTDSPSHSDHTSNLPLCTVTVVPMIHPAAAAPGRNAGLVSVMNNDWDKLADPVRQTLGKYRLVSGEFMHNLLNGVDRFAFDFETTDPDWRGTFQARRARPIGYSVAVRGGGAFYTQDSISHIRRFLEDESVEVIAHNAKFEYIVARTVGVRITNLSCTKVMAFLLRYRSTGLKDLSHTVLNVVQTRYEDVEHIITKVAQGEQVTAVELQELVEYGAADSDLTLQLADILTEQLHESDLWELYEQVERPLITKVGDMERHGIKLDARPLSELQCELEVNVASGRDWLDGQFPSDPPINWSSGQQIARILHGPTRPTVEPIKQLLGHRTKIGDRECGVRTGAQTRIRYWPPGLNLPVLDRTEGTRIPKTDMNTLRQYDHPVPDRLVYISSAETCISRELSVLPDLVQEDGRLHPSFHQAGGWEERGGTPGEAPMTGRLSASGPPIHGLTHHGDDNRAYMADWGYRIHSAIVATDSDHTLVKVDIGQEEPRIGAFLSNCGPLMDELLHGDVYLLTAALIYKRQVSREEKEIRQIGKRSFMAWLNRAGAAGVQKSAFWLADDAAWAIIKHLRQLYQEVEVWHRGLKIHLRKYGYVETYFKRRVYRPEVFTGDPKQVSHADRAIAPDCIQGTAADVLKIGWNRLDLPEGAHIILTRHDELVIDTHKDVFDAVVAACTNLTKNILPIVLPAEVSYGPNWAQQTRIV